MGQWSCQKALHLIKCSQGTTYSCTAAWCDFPIHKHALKSAKHHSRKKKEIIKNLRAQLPVTTLMTMVSTCSTVQHRQFKTLSPDPDLHALCIWNEIRVIRNIHVQYVQGFCTFSVLRSQAVKHLSQQRKPTAELRTCIIRNEWWISLS